MANAKTLRIKQVHSSIGRKYDQERTLKALGIRKMNDVVEHEDSPSIQGMIFKIKHLVEVEEI